MERLAEFYNSNQKIIIIIFLLLLFILLICLVKKIVCRRQRIKELEQASADKMRDENLNNVILNNHIEKGNIKEIYKPYDVDYSKPNTDNRNYENNDKQEGNVLVRLVEKTELSTRKFIMNPIKPIRIGRDVQGNDISVMAEDIDLHQCEIFTAGNKIYIKSIGTSNQTILKRKKDRAIVSGAGVRLLSNDTIILGSVLYEVTIIDKK